MPNVTLTRGPRRMLKMGPFEDLAAAQRAYVEAREKSGLGNSNFGDGLVIDDEGKYVARISYNGKAWPAGEWLPNMSPIAEAPKP